MYYVRTTCEAYLACIEYSKRVIFAKKKKLLMRCIFKYCYTDAICLYLAEYKSLFDNV